MIFPKFKYYTSTLLVCMGMVCGGCRMQGEPCPPDGSDSPADTPDMVTLCLNVAVEGQELQTRAEGDEEDPTVTADDNAPDRYDNPTGDFEKISTLRVIIVRNLNADKTSGIVEANRLVRTNDEGRPVQSDMEFKVIANEWKRIYLVANEKFITSSPDGFDSPTAFLESFRPPVNGAEGTIYDLSTIANWTVSLPGISSSTTQVTGYSNGLFAPSSSKRLPLTEFFDLEVKRDFEVEDQFYSRLFLTRSAAKAMFYLNTSDNFIVPDGTEIANTRITAISLSGVGTTEYVFPNSAEYNPSKESIITYAPTDRPLSTKEVYINNFATPASNREVTYVIDGLDIEIKKPADGPIAITSPIYFPESILTAGQNYTVGVRLSDGNWLYAPLNDESIRHNILSIKGTDGADHEAIARNTFLPIELNFDGSANFTVNVLPWNREDYYVDYTANIGFNEDDYLSISGTQGQTGDFLLLDRVSAQLVLNYGKVAHGRFFISSPLGTTWDAYLITTGGETDVIVFQIPDPTDSSKTINTTHISGKVGVDEANFGIVSLVAPGNEQNSAQLMVIVTLVDGTPVVANVIRNWGSNTDRLTIIQNPK